MLAFKGLAEKILVSGFLVYVKGYASIHVAGSMQCLKYGSPYQFGTRLFSTENKEAPVIDTRDVEKVVENRKLVLLDVRTSEEFNKEGHIPTAVNIHVEELESALKMDDTSFLHKYKIPKPSKSDNILVYCKKGIRSTTASNILLNQNFNNVKNYKGSWLVWREKHPEDVLWKPEE